MTQPSDSVYPKHCPPESQKASPGSKKSSLWIKNCPPNVREGPNKCPLWDPNKFPPIFFLNETIFYFMTF